MKRMGMITAVSAALAVAFACSSCTKKEDALKSTTKKEAPAPEQSTEIKKGVKESQIIVVARVDDVDITMADLVKEMNVIAPKFVPPGQASAPETTAQVKQKALNSLIFKEMAVQEAIRRGMRVEPSVVADVISKVKAQAGSEEAYKKYLEERGVDEEALRKRIEKGRLFESITAKEIFDKIKVDDKELREAYKKDKASFMTKDNPPRQLSFEEAKGFIEWRIKSERGEKRIAEWDKELRKKAKIEVVADKDRKS